MTKKWIMFSLVFLVFLVFLVILAPLYAVGAVWGFVAWVVVFFVLLAATLGFLTTTRVHNDVTILNLPLLLSLTFGLSVISLGAPLWQGGMLLVIAMAVVYLSSTIALRQQRQR